MATAPEQSDMTLDPSDLNGTDEGILRMLTEGRCTPRYLAGELDLQQPYVNQRLKRLIEHGHVERIDRGLYEIAADPRETGTKPPNSPPEPRGSSGEDRPPNSSQHSADVDRLRSELAGSGDLLDARVNAIMTMFEYLVEHGSATKDELLTAIDVDATGYQSEESVWANMVKGKDTLRAMPGVESPSAGMSTWRYTGDRDD